MKDPPAVVPGGEGVRVVIRVRPLLTKKCTNITSKEDGGGGGGLIATEVVPPTTPSEEEIVRVKVSPTTTTASKTTHEVFECDCAIRPEETQADVFRKSGKLLERGLLSSFTSVKPNHVCSHNDCNYTWTSRCQGANRSSHLRIPMLNICLWHDRRW